MKTIAFLILMFTLSTYAQTVTEKYNSYLKRYEYFDNRGQMTGYKQYNSYLKQWEYYDNKSQTQGYQIQQPQSSVDLNLAQKTLSKKQSSYDDNLKSIQNTVKIIYRNIDYLVLKVITNNPKELDYIYANHIKNLFETNCVKPIEQKGYDFSSNATTSTVNEWLVRNSISIIKQELDFLEDRDRYNYLIHTYTSLY